MPLSQHKYYVYYDGNVVYARMDNEDPVVLETCADPQAAYDKVQTIINPDGFSHEKYGPLGFNSDEFQNTISDKCEPYVKQAYNVE